MFIWHLKVQKHTTQHAGISEMIDKNRLQFECGRIFLLVNVIFWAGFEVHSVLDTPMYKIEVVWVLWNFCCFLTNPRAEPVRAHFLKHYKNSPSSLTASGLKTALNITTCKLNLHIWLLDAVGNCTQPWRKLLEKCTLEQDSSCCAQLLNIAIYNLLVWQPFGSAMVCRIALISEYMINCSDVFIIFLLHHTARHIHSQTTVW